MFSARKGAHHGRPGVEHSEPHLEGFFVGSHMSFAYMPFYTGDYLRDTRHLSMLEHGAYMLALAYCWDSKGPMPLDEKRSFGICNARSNEEMQAVRNILDGFFVCMDDGWYQPRMEREIARCNEISGARAKAGREGATARMREFRARQAIAKQLPSKSVASAQQVTPSPSPSPSLIPSPTPTPTPSGEVSPETPLRVRRKADAQMTAADLEAAGVPRSVAEDWLTVRRAKRAPLTATAWAGVVAEARKAGISPAEAVKFSAAQSWQGFKASWYEGSKPPAQNNGTGELERMALESWTQPTEEQRAALAKVADSIKRVA